MGVVDRVNASHPNQSGESKPLGGGLMYIPAVMDVVMNGDDVVKTLPYREAVSLVSRRLARFAETGALQNTGSDVVSEPEPVKPPAAQVKDETPTTPAQPVGLEPPYDQHKAAALVAELERRELSTNAKNKAELVARLEEDDADEDLIGLPGSTPEGDEADTTEDEPSPPDE